MKKFKHSGTLGDIIIFTRAGDARRWFTPKQGNNSDIMQQRTKFRAAVSVVDACGPATVTLLKIPADPDGYWPAFLTQQFIDGYPFYSPGYAALTEKGQIIWQAAAASIGIRDAHLPHPDAPTLTAGSALWIASWSLYDIDIFLSVGVPGATNNAQRWANAIAGIVTAYRLITESDDYLMTESADYLTTEAQ